MRDEWSELIPFGTAFSGRVATLFQCIHALMSHQLRELITRSLNYCVRTLYQYSDSNNNHDKKKYKKPILTLITSLVGVYFDHSHVDNFANYTDANDLYDICGDDEITPFLRKINNTLLSEQVYHILAYHHKMILLPNLIRAIR